MPDAYNRFFYAKLSEKARNSHLYATIVKHMMHGHCGNLNSKNVCMRKHGHCKNDYPKVFFFNNSRKKLISNK